MLKNNIFLFVVLMSALATCAEEQHKQIRYVQVRSMSPVSGQRMYAAYCAVCHGSVGKGDGPAAGALKAPPPDLTVLLTKNGGHYPYDHVRCMIESDHCVPTSAPREMPVWGEIFWRMSEGHSSEVQLRLSNLNRYIESLQAK